MNKNQATIEQATQIASSTPGNPSFAISDGLAALSALWVALNLVGSPNAWPAVVGILLFAMTSILGTIRFGFSVDFERIHLLSSAINTAIGIPLVSLAFLGIAFPQVALEIFWVASLVLVFGFVILGLRFKSKAYVQGIGTLGILAGFAIGGLVLAQGDGTGKFMMIADGSLLLAGIGVTTRPGKLLGIERWHWFHALMCIFALAAFGAFH